MTRPDAEERLRRLLMLTVALEDACARDDPAPIRQLLTQRERVLDELEREPQDAAPFMDLLRKIAEADARLTAKLDEQFTSLMGRLATRTTTQKLRALYGGKRRQDPQILERSG